MSRFVGSPEPELWRKVDGYSVGVYDWAIVTESDVQWFDSEDEARAAFASRPLESEADVSR